MASQRPELTLEEMLADPIVRLVMQSDGIGADDVRAVVAEARRRRWPRASSVLCGQQRESARAGLQPRGPEARLCCI